MNFLTNAFKTIVISPIQSMATNVMRCQSISSTPLQLGCSFNRMHKMNVLQEKGLLPKKKKKKSPLGPNPFLKGIILKCVVKKPRKPNSANRKCVFVRLSNGKETFAYVPGIGHNLQEHQVVLCQSKRVKDVPGLKLSCVRGKYDLPHVIKQARV